MNYKYNYIFFNVGAVRNRKKDKENYYYICTLDLEKMDNVRVISYPLDYSSYFIHCLFVLHNYSRINIPLKKIWYPFYFKRNFVYERPLCFIVYGYYIKPDYLRYLRRKYPDCKIVLLHRDLINLWRKRMPEYTDKDIQTLFDLRMTYDEEEAKKYKISYFNEFESRATVEVASEYPLFDVFFVGNAKDRLPLLCKVYDILTEQGIKCFYYITGVPEEKKVKRDGITYADSNMTYEEMLYYTVNSRCVLEINQAGAVGYTSRFLEAVMYNKKLITNNVSIKQSKFYDEKFIHCFSDISELRPEFVKQDGGKIDYGYNGEFSPAHLINQIEHEIA